MDRLRRSWPPPRPETRRSLASCGGARNGPRTFPAVHLQGSEQRDRSVTHILDRCVVPGAPVAGARRAAYGPALEWRSSRRCRKPLPFPEDAGTDRECLWPWPKIGIGTGHVALQAVRLQPDLVPDPHHRDVAYAPASRQTAGGPVGDRSRRRRLGGSHDGGLLGSPVIFRGRPARGASNSPSSPFLPPAFLPVQSAARTHAGPRLDMRTDTPSANSNNVRARRASPAETRVDRSICCKWSRSSGSNRNGSFAVNMSLYTIHKPMCHLFM